MMSPIESITTCLRKYFDFSGRASRSEYWWYILAWMIVQWIAAGLDPLLGSVGILSAAVGIGLFLPTLAVTVRRFHDTEKSGWRLLALYAVMAGSGLIAMGPMQYANAPTISYAALAILGIGSVLLLLYWCILPSDAEGNQYGPKPLSQAG